MKENVNMKIVGIVGCTVNNTNMGCMALTYSLVDCLRKLSEQSGLDIKFVFFDFTATPQGLQKMAKELGLSENQLEANLYQEWDFHNFRSAIITVKKIPDTIRAIQYIKQCNFIIDLTQGDSFSDIYGESRFYRWTGFKRLIEICGTPLVLGPQTLGPFNNDTVRKTAKKVIEDASLVIARDEESKDYVESFCDKKVFATTDLAFSLPYSKLDDNRSRKMRIGINPSGLLCRKKTDKSAFSAVLKTDYEEYMNRLIDWIIEQQIYEIHMISHVGNEANDCMGGLSNVIYHDEFSTPTEAKSYISTMDIFIGARMHATIGAISSGVATIPVAYSRKFRGLYNSIKYPYLIDLETMTTEEALIKTQKFILGYQELLTEGKKSMEIVRLKTLETERILKQLF